MPESPWSHDHALRAYPEALVPHDILRGEAMHRVESHSSWVRGLSCPGRCGACQPVWICLRMHSHLPAGMLFSVLLAASQYWEGQAMKHVGGGGQWHCHPG